MNITSIYACPLPPFLAEAAATAPMNRLKEVGMNCGCEYTSFPQFRALQSYSRFEHSLGVALIVWQHTGDRAQAMAGLLHDISTPVFAHVVDFLKGDHLTQEATEAGTEQCITASAELMDVLQRYGLAVDTVKDYHIYPIADNDTPKLSADRLEYTLGNLINFGFGSETEAKELYEDITVGENEYGEEELVFCHDSCAQRFASFALQCSRIYVADADRYSMQLLSELLGEALRGAVLTQEDLMTTEPAVIAKLKADARMAHHWQHFRSLCRMESRSDASGEGNWRRIYAKKRCIDPFVRDRGRLSQIDSAYSQALNAFLSQSQDYWVRGVTAEE